MMKDVKSRWRSVRDQYRKQQNDAEKSGSSPSKKKVAYSEQLQFINTSRVLRQSSGNIPQASQEGNPEGNSQNSASSSADLDASTQCGTGEVGNASNPSTSQQEVAGPSSQNNTQRRGARRRSVVSPPDYTVESETLSLIQRVDAEDHWDHLAYCLAARLRKMPDNRQWYCVSAIFQIMDLYAYSELLPDNMEILQYISNLRSRRGADVPHQHPPNVTSESSNPPNVESNPYTFHNYSNPRPERASERTYGSSSMSFISLLNEPLPDSELRPTRSIENEANDRQTSFINM